jgi:hypothetical protein
MEKKIQALFWFGVGGVAASFVAYIVLAISDARSIRVENPQSVPVPAGAATTTSGEVPVPAK